MFCIAIGPDPSGLPLAVCNRDAGAEYGNLGQDFIANLSPAHEASLQMVYFASMEQARQYVKEGNGTPDLNVGFALLDLVVMLWKG